MKYSYTAIIAPTENQTEYYARVPDLLSCITTGDSIEDAIIQITDAASLWLIVCEDENLPIPPATAPADISVEPGSVSSTIEIDTTSYRQEFP